MLLTRKQFRDRTGRSRQSVYQSIKNGTLTIVQKTEQKEVEYIDISEEQLQNITKRTQRKKIDGVN